MPHTPGPWTAEHYTGHPHIEIWGKIDGTPQRLAYMEDHLADSQVNCDLMAAAPDLRRGCQAALAYLADPASEFKENRDAAAEIIHAALAKAGPQEED